MRASLNSIPHSSSMAMSIINNPSVLRNPSSISQFGLSESQAEYILSAGYNRGFKYIFILNASLASPVAIRGQFYGIAAAVGKVGAFIGIWAFPPMINDFGGQDSMQGNTGPFWVGSGLAALSALITLLFIKPLSHDGMAEEDVKFREYLEAHGFDTSIMGFGETGSVTAVEESGEKEQGEKVAV